MRLNREVGDAWMVAISHNNLGNATRGLGDYAAARGHYADSLRAYRAYDDRWALGVPARGHRASSRRSTGERSAALELAGAAEKLREEIGSPRAPGLQEQLDQALATAAGALDGQGSAEAAARGRGRSFAEAVSAALAFCSDG